MMAASDIDKTIRMAIQALQDTLPFDCGVGVAVINGDGYFGTAMSPGITREMCVEMFESDAKLHTELFANRQ